MVAKKKEIEPAIKNSELPEAFVQEDVNSKLKQFPKRRVRFLKRCDYESDYIDFTMTKSGILHRYRLYDGQIYNLPEDVIQYLSSIISIERYTEYGSDDVKEYKKIYYQFDFLE